MLNPQREKFCVEYVRSGNATKAYSAAFPNASERTARVNSSRLLHEPEIQARIKELNAQIASDKICAAQEIQERLSAIARREVCDTICLPNGESVQRPTSIRDATRALELLAKISGMFVTRQEVEINGALPVIIRDDL